MVNFNQIVLSSVYQTLGVAASVHGSVAGLEALNLAISDSDKPISERKFYERPVAVSIHVPFRTRSSKQLRERVKAHGASFVEELGTFVILRSKWDKLAKDVQMSLYNDGLVSGIVVNDYTAWSELNRFPQKGMPTLVLKTCGYDEEMNNYFKSIGARWNLAPAHGRWSWTPGPRADMSSVIRSLNNLQVIDFEMSDNKKELEAVPNDFSEKDWSKVMCPDSFVHNYDFLIASAMTYCFDQSELAHASGMTAHVLVTREFAGVEQSGLNTPGDSTRDDERCRYASATAAGDIGLRVHVFIPQIQMSGVPGDKLVKVRSVELCGNPSRNNYGCAFPAMRRRGEHRRPSETGGPQMRMESDYKKALRFLNAAVVYSSATARGQWSTLATQATKLLETRTIVIDPQYISNVASNGHFIPGPPPTPTPATSSVSVSNYAMNA